MRRLVVTTTLMGAVLFGPAQAYEYPLQLTPNYGWRGLVVAGYAFVGRTVAGNCSYRTVSSGGARGNGPSTTYYNQHCIWDLYGNLLSIVQGLPVIPAPLSVVGGLTTYARSAQGNTAGLDTVKRIGFVTTPSAQYSWLTPATYVVLPNQQPLQLTLTIQSTGDFPLVVSKVEPSALLAKVSVTSNSCQPAGLRPGALCKIVVSYDARVLQGRDDPYTAYDTMKVGLVSNAGQSPDFAENLEIPVAPGS